LEGIGFLVSRVTFYLRKVNIDMCIVLDPWSFFLVHFSTRKHHLELLNDPGSNCFKRYDRCPLISKEGIQHHAVSIFEKVGN
jgi:hypothetical protein